MFISNEGGYNFATTSRLWTYLTSIIANVEINNDIPEHDDLMTYSPDFELFTTASKVIKNKNTQEYISESFFYLMALLRQHLEE